MLPSLLGFYNGTHRILFFFGGGGVVLKILVISSDSRTFLKTLCALKRLLIHLQINIEHIINSKRCRGRCMVQVCCRVHVCVSRSPLSLNQTQCDLDNTMCHGAQLLSGLLSGGNNRLTDPTPGVLHACWTNPALTCVHTSLSCLLVVF